VLKSATFERSNAKKVDKLPMKTKSGIKSHIFLFLKSNKLFFNVPEIEPFSNNIHINLFHIKNIRSQHKPIS